MFAARSDPSTARTLPRIGLPMTVPRPRPPDPLRCILRSVVCLGLLFVPLRAAAAESQPAEHSTLPAAELVVRDLRLTVKAREALREDADLAALNLGVSLRGGVATVWGPVPSLALAWRAVQKLQRLPGVSEVRNDTSVVPPEELPPPPGKRPPKPSDPALWDRAPSVTGSLTGLAAKHGLTSSPEEGEGPAPPGDTAVPAQPAANLLAPVPLDAHQALLGVVQRLLTGSERHERLRAELRERTVFLRGTVARGEDLQELARTLARVPGVDRVVVDAVQVESRPGGSPARRPGLRIED